MAEFITVGYWGPRKGSDLELCRLLREMARSRLLANVDWRSKGSSKTDCTALDFADDDVLRRLTESGRNRTTSGTVFDDLGVMIALWSESESTVLDFSLQYGSVSSHAKNCYVLEVSHKEPGEHPLDLEAVFRDLIQIWNPEVAVLCSDEFFYSHDVNLDNAPTDWLAYSTKPLPSQSGIAGTAFHEGTITAVSS